MSNETAKAVGEQGDAETARMIEGFADNVRSNNSFINAAKARAVQPETSEAVRHDVTFVTTGWNRIDQPDGSHAWEAVAEAATRERIAAVVVPPLAIVQEQVHGSKRATAPGYVGNRQGSKSVAATIESLGRQILAANRTITEQKDWIVQCERTIAGFRASEVDKDAEIVALRAELAQAKRPICQPTGSQSVDCPSDNPLARRFRGGVGQAFEDRS